jgi:glutathione reductase (NADPH)
MSSYDYDLFVIGAGSGGVRASRIAAGFGARVGIAEHYRVGGTCVIRGCIPKKLLVYASHFSEEFEDAAAYGWSVGESRFSWQTLITNKDKEIARLEGIYMKLLQGSGVEVMRERAIFLDAHTLQVGDRRVTAANVIVATGGWPHMPEMPGVEHCKTSNDMFELTELPRRILVVGGGYIAVEFAGIFNGLGSEVTLSYRGDKVLRGFDEDVREHLGAEMAAKGVRFSFGSQLAGVEKKTDGALVARLVVGAKEHRLECDAVLLATGRWPSTRGIGLEQAGVKLDAVGAVAVDEYSRSCVPHIFAVGDVTDRIALTPVAIREGQAVSTTLFGGGQPVPVDHRFVASAVFSQPPVAVVGLSEAQALEACGEVHVYKTAFRPLKHTLTGRAERTLMKLVVEGATGRVIGAHMVGVDAAEIIQGIAIAVKAGLTKADFDATVGIHPTAAEEFVTLREKQVVSRAVSGSAA